MINFNWYRFSELTVEQLYAVLALRAEVFVVEQDGAYLDPDGKDEFALHLLGMNEGSLVAYLRLFPPNCIENYIIFGRVATRWTVRSKGYGKRLMKELLAYCDINFPEISIKCSARAHLKQFYEHLGFKVHGTLYEEDGFPHLEMIRD
jgi:ElaA protein